MLLYFHEILVSPRPRTSQDQCFFRCIVSYIPIPSYNVRKDKENYGQEGFPCFSTDNSLKSRQPAQAQAASMKIRPNHMAPVAMM